MPMYPPLIQPNIRLHIDVPLYLPQPDPILLHSKDDGFCIFYYRCKHPEIVCDLIIYTNCTLMYNHSAVCFFLKFMRLPSPPPSLNVKIC